MMTDRQLLQLHVSEKSETAFAELVRRHVNLVYGTARRLLCGDSALAEDVTQAVFAALAAKSAARADITHLPAWLYATTRHTVAHTVRTERRRREREQKAQLMHAVLAEPDHAGAPALPPGLLDPVLESLDENDREAVLRRFFSGESFGAIGEALNLSEDAARMRVTRALEKIRELFVRHGVTSSAAAVSALLVHQAVAAPAHLAASVSTAVLTGTAAITATTGGKLGLLSLLTSTKNMAGLAGIAVAVTIGLTVYSGRQNALTAQLAPSRSSDGVRTQQAVQSPVTLPKAPVASPAAPAVRPMAKSPGHADDQRAKNAERMAQLKPRLEAGMPIRGAIIVLVDGQPVQRPVEFVMGRETRIEAADDGTYCVTPTLNPDGSVRYAISLATRVAETGREKIDRLPAVIQTPWDGFTLGTGRGRVMAFDPDKIDP